mmetsp:Transcript_36574/g.117928  ORF Transcript_36574/g.117928 Transcript_36574/m.117928 type:complete len:283 (+) Transcript_36574:905-1753(+)
MRLRGRPRARSRPARAFRRRPHQPCLQGVRLADDVPAEVPAARRADGEDGARQEERRRPGARHDPQVHRQLVRPPAACGHGPHPAAPLAVAARPPARRAALGRRPRAWLKVHLEPRAAHGRHGARHRRDPGPTPVRRHAGDDCGARGDGRRPLLVARRWQHSPAHRPRRQVRPPHGAALPRQRRHRGAVPNDVRDAHPRARRRDDAHRRRAHEAAPHRRPHCRAAPVRLLDRAHRASDLPRLAPAARGRVRLPGRPHRALGPRELAVRVVGPPLRAVRAAAG